jgi:hypothetical protein
LPHFGRGAHYGGAFRFFLKTGWQRFKQFLFVFAMPAPASLLKRFSDNGACLVVRGNVAQHTKRWARATKRKPLSLLFL